MDRAYGSSCDCGSWGPSAASYRVLHSPKGLLLALVVSLLSLPIVIASLFAPRFQLAEQIQQIRRFGPPGLLVFCLFNLLLSSNERSVYFSPAEVDVLFPGPFHPRHLLLYRMMGGFFSSLLGAFLFSFLMKHHAVGFFQAFVGLFLAFELLTLASMAVGLLAGKINAVAFNRRRKIALIAIVCSMGAVLATRGQQSLAFDGPEFLIRLGRSSLVRIISSPFRPPIMAFTAERLWPDLVVWTLWGLGVLAALAIAILIVNAEYYEATASASARIYARRQATSLGRMASRPIKTRVALPMLPRLWGMGPNLWRQLTTAARHPGRFAVLFFFFLGPLALLILIEGHDRVSEIVDLRVLAGLIALWTINASMFVGFDFHSDIDRMDVLKSLPTSPLSLVVSEFLVTVLLLIIVQWACLALVASVRGDATSLLESSIFLAPLDALFVEVEAACFLWFPIRIVPGSTMAFSVVVRQVFLLLAKIIVTGFAAGISVGMGAVVFYVLIPNRHAALAVAWLTIAGSVLAMIPIVVMAFNQYDVARDNPT